MESEKVEKVDNQCKEMSTGKKESTEQSQKSKGAVDSIESQKVNREDVGDEDQIEEEQSHCSNEEESAAGPATTHRNHSPNADTMTTSESGTSTSPSHSMSNVESHIDRHDGGHDEQHDKGIIEDDPHSNVDEGAKASWESGILDLSSSSFLTVKLLVSNNMAGSIIGRAGETISELQEQSSSRIKLGQSGDYYPGTSERACLVHGSLDNVKKAATLLLQKLYDLQIQQVESQLGRQGARSSKGALKDDEEEAAEKEAVEDDGNKEGEETSTTSISFSVRMLIPSASCGMLIGRNGINIKKMKETSRVSSIRLSAKELDHANSNMHFSSESMAIAATSERILTISGKELNACISCAFLILEGFARHPDICRYANNTTSYSKIASSFQSHYGSSQMAYPVRSSSRGNMPSIPQTRGNRPSPAYLSSPHHSQNVQRMQRDSLRFSGDRPHDATIRMHGSNTDDRRNQHQQQMYRNTSIVSPQLGPQVSSHLQPAPVYAGMPAAPRHAQGTGATPQDTPQQIRSVKISVSDTMVGAILGKRGQTLMELQNKSGTKIKISQRGEFIPGTNNRIVTISGPNNECIASAKSLIRQQLATHDRMISPLPDEES